MNIHLQAPSTPISKQSFDLEQEKMLPGVIMAAGGQVFEMLYQLSELGETKYVDNIQGAFEKYLAWHYNSTMR